MESMNQERIRVMTALETYGDVPIKQLRELLLQRSKICGNYRMDKDFDELKGKEPNYIDLIRINTELIKQLLMI